MIKGNKITLVPAALEDKQKIYEWCFHSETTKAHSGPPDYPDVPIPGSEEFFEDYADYFFTGAAPQNGRGFMILHDGEPVGFISYCSFHLQPQKAELDIWMNCEANCGKGFGSDAVFSLAEYLHQNLGVTELIMRPSVKNARAIKAYKKAGFEKSGKAPAYYLLEEYMPLYGDGDYGVNGDALLVKKFD
ncbi:MAG: GNAT family N-acetyltransferase, partial [Clostridiales bacterium]|nr:GNAT family N-acetyltransferase [Clostridiales bacterium]